MVRQFTQTSVRVEIFNKPTSQLIILIKEGFEKIIYLYFLTNFIRISFKINLKNHVRKTNLLDKTSLCGDNYRFFI